MSSLPDGVSNLGPVYVSQIMKELYVKACQIDGIMILDGIKIDATNRIRKHFPEFPEYVPKPRKGKKE